MLRIRRWETGILAPCPCSAWPLLATCVPLALPVPARRKDAPARALAEPVAHSLSTVDGQGTRAWKTRLGESTLDSFNGAPGTACRYAPPGGA